MQFGGEFDPLRLAPDRWGRLAEPDIAEPHVHQRPQMPGDRGHRGEEVGALLDRHVEHLGDGLALVVHLERLAVVAAPWQTSHGYVDVGQEVHLDLDGAVAGAGLTAPTLDVEGEATGR